MEKTPLGQSPQVARNHQDPRPGHPCATFSNEERIPANLSNYLQPFAKLHGPVIPGKSP